MAHLVDPLPLFIVLGGAFSVACVQMGIGVAGSALLALPRLVRADPDADRQQARVSANAADRLVDAEGLGHAERTHSRPGFVADALVRLGNMDSTHFEIWADQALGDRAGRHARVIAFWDALADAAPAMGMAATIWGLVSMFASMDDPSRIGPAMALALLATLYGLILANMIAAPVARRLEWLSGEELGWQRELTGRLLAISRREEAAMAVPPAPLPTPPRSRRSPVREPL